jgi:uncharacterized protein (DUF169 family)
MSLTQDLDQIRAMADRMISTLGLSSSPVGVRMLSDPKDLPGGAERLERYRYCQALMKARRGQDVFLDGEGISCPAVRPRLLVFVHSPPP